MPAPSHVVEWIRQNYPSPRVAEDWLSQCCDWIVQEFDISPQTQREKFIENVEKQLLESDLRDSMEQWTGFPHELSDISDNRICETPLLVEITSITEIGHSAFNLYNVRQTRIERVDLAGLAEEEGVESDEGPIPNYPRQMLKLELSDGTTTAKAIEYRSIPELKLGETPLGFKMLLRNVLVRRGILFLEPNSITLLGHLTSDREEYRDKLFLRSLLERMSKPVPSEDEPNNERDAPQSPPETRGLLVPPMNTRESNNSIENRSPPREIPEANTSDFSDAMDHPRKRKRSPSKDGTIPSAAPSSVTDTSQNTLFSSRFFSRNEISLASTPTLVSESIEGSLASHTFVRMLSPVRGDPIDITASSISTDDTESTSHPPVITRNKSPSLRSISDEFENDYDDIDFEVLDQVEEQARNREQTIAQSYTQDNTPVQTDDSQSVVAYPSQTQTRRPSPEPEIIVLDDDDEDDNDKENNPIQKRRKRRRVSVENNDVIDISD